MLDADDYPSVFFLCEMINAYSQHILLRCDRVVPEDFSIAMCVEKILDDTKSLKNRAESYSKNF